MFLSALPLTITSLLVLVSGRALVPTPELGPELAPELNTEFAANRECYEHNGHVIYCMGDDVETTTTITLVPATTAATTTATITDQPAHPTTTTIYVTGTTEVEVSVVTDTSSFFITTTSQHGLPNVPAAEPTGADWPELGTAEMTETAAAPANTAAAEGREETLAEILPGVPAAEEAYWPAMTGDDDEDEDEDKDEDEDEDEDEEDWDDEDDEDFWPQM